MHVEGEESYGVLGFTPLLIKDLVSTKYGKAKWDEIITKSGLLDDFHIHHKYSKDAFGKLAGSCCEVLKLNVDELMEVCFSLFLSFIIFSPRI